MRARDIMTSPAHVIRQNASLESAAELMTAEAVTVPARPPSRARVAQDV
jgi:CBS domain-containing protein